MACERFAAALNDHAAGAEIDARLAAHLAECDRCRVALQRRRQLLSELDREVRDAISVDPSAIFVAQVRARIAAQPAETASWSLRVAIAVAASVAIALGALLLQVWSRTGASGQIATIAPVSAQPSTTAEVPDRSMPSRVTMPPRLRQLRGRSAPLPSARRVLPAEPEVLVPAAHAEAVRRLVRAVAEGRVDIPADALRATDRDVAPIAVEPVTIAPIEVAGRPRQNSGRPLNKGVEPCLENC